MKITWTLLSFCFCILLLSTFAKSELPATRKRDIGAMGEKFFFCPIQQKTSKQIQEIIAILKQSTTSQRQLPLFDSRNALRQVRSTSSCVFPLPHCGIASLRIDVNGQIATHKPMEKCCTGCSDVFTICVRKNKLCFDCVHTWTSCMNKCTESHFCSFFRGWKGVKASGPRLDGSKGSTQPIVNLCPTEKVKNGGSYCIKRSCYSIRV